MTITDSTIKSNEVVNPSGSALGGGIYALNSTVNVTNSTVNGNKAKGSVLGEGGGIYSSGGLLDLLASRVKGNKASTDSDDLFLDS